jgi:two-component system sensor histidine kinase PilS (NtrC family)
MTSYQRKLLWLIAGRAAVLTVLLGSGLAMKVVSPETLPISTDTLFGLIAVAYGLTIAYALLLERTMKHPWVADVQLAIDAVVVSGIVDQTGGVNSYFSSLYALPIIAASIVQSRRGAWLVCILTCLLYGGIVAGQYSGALPVTGFTAQILPPVKLALYTVTLNILGFVAIALLTGYLAEGLRQADIRLQQASDEIQDLQAFSRHVIDSLTSGLVTTDIEGRIITFNRAASVITGIPESEAIGANAAIIFNLPIELGSFFGARDERPRLPRVDFHYTRRDGREVEMGLSTAVLMTPRGEAGFLLTFQDVTEARRLEREAQIQQRLAAVGEMAAGIAHEIRNPLASIAGSMQILRQDLALTPDQAQLMDIVLRESERLNETIRSFLAYAKPQRQSLVTVDVGRVITETATILENSPELSDAHVISLEIPTEPCLLQADEGQLRQIVWNLATNGLRAMAAGGRLTLGVRDAASPEGEPGVLIEVRDEGRGIPKGELDGIFQPFRTGFPRGTGLGLSIVQRIVADYGGQINVSSAPGQGTAVSVRFPAGAAVPAVPGKVA